MFACSDAKPLVKKGLSVRIISVQETPRQALKARRLKGAIADSDDDVSTVSSKPLSKTKSKPKPVKKKRIVKSKFPAASETPDAQNVTRYFTPNEALKASVPSTISTSASTRASNQSNSQYTSS